MLLGIVVVVNIVIFGRVMKRLTCGRKTTSSARNKQEKREETSQRVQNAIAITILMGLTWVFGLLSIVHEDSSIAFQYLFCFVNSIQGLAIFVMFCVRQPDVRKEWISCCKLCGKEGNVAQSPGDTRQKTTATTISSSEF